MKNIVKILGRLAAVTLILLLNSCYYDGIIERPTDQPIDNTPLSFQTDIQPIFDANCIVCHNGNLDPDLRDGNSYAALSAIPGSIVAGDADGSELVDMLEHKAGVDNPMPPSAPIDAASINKFKTWINQGALNN